MARVETTQKELTKVAGILKDAATAIEAAVTQMQTAKMQSIPIHATALEKNAVTMLQTCNRIKTDCESELLMKRLGVESPIQNVIERSAKQKDNERNESRSTKKK